ncbi:hypothetical protein BKA66DRAFT_576300 [Pyrenochaeta sp. MPI-SDFR-AT-0127]|nr:hypothetical protein BKA66DRAFT_576300 [Pyrenochaeta sp. MPI-SDFR-AT-0127]
MVQWTAEKDQIILRGIFKFHDIKSSTPLLKYLANEIGEDCTPKAVSHRLNNIRNTGAARNSGSVPSTPSRPHATPKTPRSRTKATPKKKNNNNNDSDGPEGLIDEEEPMSPSDTRAKRAKRPSYVEAGSVEEPDYVIVNKRVKTEPLDDVEDHSIFPAAYDNDLVDEI